MLVLTRKRTEMIQIGENIFVKLIQIGKSTVKIGIEAPSDVRVLRGELAGDDKQKAITSLADLLHARHTRMDVPGTELVVH